MKKSLVAVGGLRRRRGWIIGETQQSVQRDVSPVGPIANLVAQLVERLFELEQAQQTAVGRAPAVERRAMHCVVVSAQKCAARFLFPSTRQRRELVEILRSRRL